MDQRSKTDALPDETEDLLVHDRETRLVVLGVKLLALERRVRLGCERSQGSETRSQDGHRMGIAGIVAERRVSRRDVVWNFAGAQLTIGRRPRSRRHHDARRSFETSVRNCQGKEELEEQDARGGGLRSRTA